MTNLHIVSFVIWPQIQFNYSYTLLQSLFDRINTTFAAELITSKIGIMAGEQEIMS